MITEENGHLVRIDEANEMYQCVIYIDEDGELIVRMERGNVCRAFRVNKLEMNL